MHRSSDLNVSTSEISREYSILKRKFEKKLIKIHQQISKDTDNSHSRSYVKSSENRENQKSEEPSPNTTSKVGFMPVRLVRLHEDP